MKILCIGDVHAKDFLSYADYISDKRISEKQEILDFIVNQAKDCQHIVFLGDLFHSKNNSSETNRWVVEFLEKFGNKDIYIISGNHDKKGDGSTAIDFLREVNKKNWHIFTKPEVVCLEDPKTIKLDFLPYVLNSELKVENSEQATTKIMEEYLFNGDILFTHHNITGTVFNGISTDTLKGVVLPKEELEKKYKLIIAGDIHTPQQYGNVIITGSIFTSEVGEHEKFIWKIDSDMVVEKIKLPCRPIYKLVNPTEEQLDNVPNNAIVKVVVIDPKIDVEELRLKLVIFDASLLVEDYPSTRKKMKIDKNNAMDFSIESLLKLYSEAKNVDYQKLVHGLELLNA